jgi:hypothetical protein
VKGVTFAWIAAVVMRSTGWAAIGLRRPVRPASALYGAPVLLLGAAALAVVLGLIGLAGVALASRRSASRGEASGAVAAA